MGREFEFYSTPAITEEIAETKDDGGACAEAKRRFTKGNIKRQILPRAVSVKAHSLLGPILLPSHLLHLWAVAGTAAWAHSECNHWRARISSSVPVSGYDVGPHQAASVAALQLESTGFITASYRGG